VALTTAVTTSPFLSFNSSALRRVMTLNHVVRDTNNHMGHDIAELNLFDFSAQFVSS
jgi:hypothetical protein